MTPQGKNALIVGGLFAGVGLIGLAWYLVGESNKKDTPCPGDNMHKDENGNCVLNTIQTPAPPVYLPTPPVSNGKPQNILAFQQYANSKGWSPKLVEDNAWGPKTLEAWTALKAEYLKPVVVPTAPVVSPIKKLTGFVLGEKLYANDNNTITNTYKTAAPSPSNIYKTYKPNYFIGTYIMDAGSMISIATPEVGTLGTTYKEVYALKGNVFATK